MTTRKRPEPSSRYVKTAAVPCPSCATQTEHDILLGKDSRLHSTCIACHKDVVSFVEAVLVTAERHSDCGSCGTATLQFRYESPRAQTYWLCASCGRESTRD